MACVQCETKEVKALNSSGRAGHKATIDFYKEQGYSKIPARGPLAANTVPGAVAGWGAAYDYATAEMDSTLQWKELLEHAIRYAKEGFPVTASQEYWTNVNLDETNQEFRALQRFGEFARIFLKDGKPYQEGELLKQQDLGDTRTLHSTGRRRFIIAS